MIRNNRRTPEDQSESSSSLAGWLFADSFLALAVVFLATISFVPDVSGYSNRLVIGAKSPGVQTNGKNSNLLRPFPITFEAIYDTDQLAGHQTNLIDLLKLDERAWVVRNKIEGTARISSATIIGGYDSTQQKSIGLSSAEAIVAMTNTQEPNFFPAGSTTITAEKSERPGLITIRLTFSY